MSKAFTTLKTQKRFNVNSYSGWSDSPARVTSLNQTQRNRGGKESGLQPLPYELTAELECLLLLKAKKPTQKGSSRIGIYGDLKDASEIGTLSISIRSNYRLDGSIPPCPQAHSLQLSPGPSDASQAAIPHPPFAHDSLRAYPPYLLHGRLRHSLRCHRRATWYRLYPRSANRRRTSGGLPTWPGQRSVHHRGPLLRIYVRPWWHWHCALGPCPRSSSS